MKRLFPVLFVFFAIPVISASAARAQESEPKILTEDAIRKYYQESVDVMKRPYDDYLAFLKKSMTDDFEVASTVKITIHGQSPATQVDRQTKQSLLANAPSAHKGVKGATVTSEVKKIALGEDGKSALVTSSATIRGMALPAPDGKALTADSSAVCDDEVILSVQGNIQTSKSTCSLDMTITPGQSL